MSGGVDFEIDPYPSGPGALFTSSPLKRLIQASLYARPFAVSASSRTAIALGPTPWIAPNGAGKTTTIEILEGFRQRSAGDVTVLGVDPAQADEAWRSRTGVVLQSWRDHPRWTPRMLRRMTRRQSGAAMQAARDQAAQWVR